MPLILDSINIGTFETDCHVETTDDDLPTGDEGLDHAVRPRRPLSSEDVRER